MKKEMYDAATKARMMGFFETADAMEQFAKTYVETDVCLPLVEGGPMHNLLKRGQDFDSAATGAKRTSRQYIGERM